ncbi:MAG: Na+/H+ antiporter subunit E [Anaerolineae bacterium]
MKIARYVGLAFPLALVWMALTTQTTLDSFLVGYLLGLAVLVLLDSSTRAGLRHVPRATAAVLIYLLVLLRDILLSGIDVARRVLSPRLALRPGVIRVPIGDEDGGEVIAALSAHGMTITPGELVIAFEDDNRVMLVHCLDVEDAQRTAQADQAQRMRYFRRILGRD